MITSTVNNINCSRWMREWHQISNIPKKSALKIVQVKTCTVEIVEWRPTCGKSRFIIYDSTVVEWRPTCGRNLLSTSRLLHYCSTICHLTVNESHNTRCSEHSCLLFVTGKQAVVVMACENLHMAEDMIIEPGLVMIFAHGVEWSGMSGN